MWYNGGDNKNGISTHALRMEGDWKRAGAKKYTLIFLPTPSAWRATAGAKRGQG